MDAAAAGQLPAGMTESSQPLAAPAEASTHAAVTRPSASAAVGLRQFGLQRQAQHATAARSMRQLGRETFAAHQAAAAQQASTARLHTVAATPQQHPTPYSAQAAAPIGAEHADTPALRALFEYGPGEDDSESPMPHADNAQPDNIAELLAQPDLADLEDHPHTVAASLPMPVAGQPASESAPVLDTPGLHGAAGENAAPAAQQQDSVSLSPHPSPPEQPAALTPATPARLTLWQTNMQHFRRSIAN